MSDLNNVNDVIDVKAKSIGLDGEKAEQLKTIGWVSYLLHLIVSVAAVVPGALGSRARAYSTRLLRPSWSGSASP